jgi:hypothetical protein
MAAITTEEANQSHARAPRRRSIHSAWYVVGALLVAFGSAAGATMATRWLLGGMQPQPRATVPHAHAPLPVLHDGITLGGGSPLAVGMGATQSYDDLAITIDHPQIVAANGFAGAPSGSHFAIVTVTLANTDPVRSLPYNGAEFWLNDGTGKLAHEVFAADAQPLGVGQVAPHSQVTGEVAFLVTANPDPNAADPQVIFAPSAAPAFALQWDLPLVPLLP